MKCLNPTSIIFCLSEGNHSWPWFSLVSYFSSILVEEKHDTESARPKRRKLFSEMQETQLNEHYNAYFSLSHKDKLSLAASLGLPFSTIEHWMCQKRQKEKLTLERVEDKEQESINVTGIRILSKK